MPDVTVHREVADLAKAPAPAKKAEPKKDEKAKKSGCKSKK